MGRGFRSDSPWYCEFYQRGELRLDELISGHVRLDGINAALESLHGATGRTLITFDE